MDHPDSSLNRKRITILIAIICISIYAFAFIVETPQNILRGEWEIITSPSILITDYIAYANLGAALFNAALVMTLALGMSWSIKARFNGYLLAAFFTLGGFAFFGKNPFNILPIFLGVKIYDELSHMKMRDLIAPLLFGTTLAPVVSQTAFGFDLGVWGLILGILLGVIAGFLLAGLMKHVYKFHLGYNLYNTGTTAGFVGTVIYMMMRGFGLEIQPAFYWATEYTTLLTWWVAISLVLIIGLGFLWGANWKSYKRILKSWGELTSDYVVMTDLGTTLVNMGVVGLIGLAYVRLVGGDLNGATLAGIFTIFAFGALGKHPRNILPIMIGVYIMCIPNIWNHTDPGPLLAALFCTTLAPFAGRFGVLAGILAGAIHLPMVMHVGGLHGYMNLYNNGFAGGLAMLLLIGFIQNYRPQWLQEPEDVPAHTPVMH